MLKKVEINSDYKYNEAKSNNKHQSIENKTLIVTTILNILLATFEISFYFVTKSSSILFDGLFSLVMTITCVLALLLSIFSKKKSLNYYFGKSIFDNIFSLFKSLLLILMCLYFLVDSSTIINQLVTNQKNAHAIDNYMYYAIYISIACIVSVIITLVYYFMNRKIDNKSILLKAEIKSSIFDFLISFAIGFSLLISNIFAQNNYIREMVDKSVTIGLIILMLPFLLKSLIIDLLIISGYRMFKDEEKELLNHLNDYHIIDIYIKRHNKQKTFLIKLDIDNLDFDIKLIKQSICNHIYDHYSNDSEIIFIV